MPQLTSPANTAVESRDTASAAGQWRPWRRRIVRGGVLLLVLLGICLAVLGYQHQRKQYLIAVVREAGGRVRDDRTLLSRIGYWQEYGQLPSNRVAVNLDQADSDPAWLRKHDWLSGLGIQMLASFEGKVTGADLARLIDAHPLIELHLQGTDFTDEIIAAVTRKSELECLSLVDCNLTSEQLERLPLEQLSYLTLVDATLSPADLQLLERCENLSVVSLDGRQFTARTAELLASLGTVKHILLYGGDVTDHHLLLLRSIESLTYIDLAETSATPEGIADLKQAMPGCAITP